MAVKTIYLTNENSEKIEKLEDCKNLIDLQVLYISGIQGEADYRRGYGRNFRFNLYVPRFEED